MKTKLEQIKELLGLAEEVKLESAKLLDGGTIEAESFEKDKDVFIVTEDEKVPLPIGDYELEDGRILVIIEEGVISEVKDKAPEEKPEEAPEEVVEQSEEVQYVTKAEFDELARKIEALTAHEKADEKQEEEVELSDDKFKHSPEKDVSERANFKLGANRNGESIQDRIFQKLFNKG